MPGWKDLRSLLLGVRSLGLLVREVRLLRQDLHMLLAQLTRIANAQEGIPPPAVPAPADVFDPPEVFTGDRDFAQVEAVESRLRQTLGRDPTPEELVHELDGEEY